MTTTSMNMLDLIPKSQSHDADIDLLREGLRLLAQAMMEADMTAQIGAALGEHAPEQRTTHRNGYRERRWDTRGHDRAGDPQGTAVLMADGTTNPIEDVEVGDWIWATDPRTGQAGPRQGHRHHHRGRPQGPRRHHHRR